jgi:hypothetical protein
MRRVVVCVVALYVALLGCLIWFEDPRAPLTGWLRVADGFAAVSLMLAMTVGPALLLAMFIYRYLLPPGPLTLQGAAILFGVGSASSCAPYGHGPMPVLLGIAVGEADRGMIIWMITTGLLVTGVVAWRSHSGRLKQPDLPP